jgi:phosphoserine phosphatase
LLKRFSKSFAVNPDEKLREVAENNNWDTIE